MTFARLLPAAAVLFAASRAAAHGIASGAAATHLHAESFPAWALASLAIGAVAVGLALRARSSRR